MMFWQKRAERGKERQNGAAREEERDCAKGNYNQLELCGPTEPDGRGWYSRTNEISSTCAVWCSTSCSQMQNVVRSEMRGESHKKAISHLSSMVSPFLLFGPFEIKMRGMRASTARHKDKSYHENSAKRVGKPAKSVACLCPLWEFRIGLPIFASVFRRN